jgi:hypothetical protein
LRKSAGRGSEVGFEPDFVNDEQELALLREYCDKLSQILVAFHRFLRRLDSVATRRLRVMVQRDVALPAVPPSSR